MSDGAPPPAPPPAPPARATPTPPPPPALTRESSISASVTTSLHEWTAEDLSTAVGHLGTHAQYKKVATALAENGMDGRFVANIEGAKLTATNLAAEIGEDIQGVRLQKLVNLFRDLRMNPTEERRLFAMVRSAPDVSFSSRGKLTFPSEWQDFAEVSQDEWLLQWDLFPVTCGTPEFHRVAQLLVDSLPEADVKSIERVQHRLLWKRFSEHEVEIARKCASLGVEPHIFEMWHGTSETMPKHILRSEAGLDERLSSDGFYGKGIYLVSRVYPKLGSRRLAG